MVAKLFRHHIVDNSWVPRWLTGPNRGRIMYSMGLAFDAIVQWAQDGVLERFPLVCSEEALFWIGRDRGIRRGFVESTESYRQRLTQWRQMWRLAGTAWAVLSQIQSYFLPQVPLVRLVTGGTTIAQWWTLDSEGTKSFYRATPSNWNWDSLEPGQSPLDNQRRFWIIIYQPTGDVDNLFPPLGTVAEQNVETTRGTSGHVQAAKDLLIIAEQWKMAGSWCAGIIIAHSTSIFDPTDSGAGFPDGRWYRYSDPTTYLPVRNTSARYFLDRRRPGLYEEGLTSEIP